MSSFDNPYNHEQDDDYDEPDPCEKCGGRFSGEDDCIGSLCDGCGGDNDGRPCHSCECPQTYELEAAEDYCQFCGGLYEEKRHLEALIKTWSTSEIQYCSCSRSFDPIIF